MENYRLIKTWQKAKKLSFYLQALTEEAKADFSGVNEKMLITSKAVSLAIAKGWSCPTAGERTNNIYSSWNKLSELENLLFDSVKTGRIQEKPADAAKKQITEIRTSLKEIIPNINRLKIAENQNRERLNKNF